MTILDELPGEWQRCRRPTSLGEPSELSAGVIEHVGHTTAEARGPAIEVAAPDPIPGRATTAGAA